MGLKVPQSGAFPTALALGRQQPQQIPQQTDASCLLMTALNCFLSIHLVFLKGLSTQPGHTRLPAISVTNEFHVTLPSRIPCIQSGPLEIPSLSL